ncbi:unnamed protein product [Ectocarpus sp. CCAP 1310/34]|nr:unnamed protein product [Ectocarpus sp. CCAP 1310/34]
MWAPGDFVPAHLQTAADFWSEEILLETAESDRATLLGWVEGVNLHDFIDKNSRGVFQGLAYDGSDITAAHFPNHVPDEHAAWVTSEVAALAATGCIAKWRDVADVAIHPKPHLVLPLGVEPKKPRLIWDARWLNLMCLHSPFSMDGVGKVAQCAWQGAHQVTIDHKAGYHHVALDPDSWQYFGFEWEGEMYVFTVLAFGWCSAPFIYSSLSEAVARYLRARDIPVLTWIDDFYLTNFRSTRMLSSKEQFQAALTAAYVALEVFYRAGYFLSIKKSELSPTTCLVFLGIICDAERGRFEVPEDKLAKLDAILTDAISSQVISFQMLEKLVGKCVSLSVAVPVAALYTHHMYKSLTVYQRTGGRRPNMDIDISPNGGLMFEMQRWLEVRKKFNGASWYRAEHKLLSLTGASDASSRGWGGLIRSPGQPIFKAGGDFPPQMAHEHINVQEGYALQQLLHLFSDDRPTRLAGSTLVSDVDSKVLHDAFRRGRASNTLMHDVITDLFWLQIEQDFTLKLRWVSSKANAEADRISRPGSDDFVRIDEQTFGELCQWAGETVTMDLMATPASVHKTWDARGCTEADLPFYSRYHTPGCAGVDVLTHDLRFMPGSATQECFGFCFPPTSMVGVFLQHLEECQARAIVVVPDHKQYWFPRMASAARKSRKLSVCGGVSPFFRVHHQRGSERFHFKRWDMVAVVVDFTKH